MNLKTYLFCCVLLAITVSCTPKLTGTWNIQKYENIVPGGQTVTLENIGTMQFKRNGEGEKNIQYSILGVSKKDQEPFGWHLTGNWLGIESRGSEFSKTWIITERKRKLQKLKSTDGAAGSQVLTLTR